MFKLPELPYDYAALEPHIDAETMKLHHTKHHQAYTDKFNDAIKGTEWEGKNAEEIIQNLDQLPSDIQTAVRNNGGGYVNHKLFWEIMSPDGGGEPTGALSEAIDSELGGFSSFKEKLSEAAKTRFGSGWAWLCLTPEGKLHVVSTANQDSTMMPEAFGGMGKDHTPLLGLDVWEHAYYKKYGPARPDYIEAWWNVVNWEKVNELYEAAK